MLYCTILCVLLQGSLLRGHRSELSFPAVLPQRVTAYFMCLTEGLSTSFAATWGLRTTGRSLLPLAPLPFGSSRMWCLRIWCLVMIVL